MRLARLKESGFTLTEVADFALNLPHDSAVARTLDPDWAVTVETRLLQAVEHGIRVLAWQSTKDAALRHPQNYPERHPVTLEEAKARKPTTEYDVSTIEEMDRFLGWD